LNRHLSLGYVWEKDYFGKGQNLGANHEMSMAYVFDHTSDKGMGIADGETALDTIGVVAEDPGEASKNGDKGIPKTSTYALRTNRAKPPRERNHLPQKRGRRKNDSLSYFTALVKENKNVIDELILRQDSIDEARMADLENRFEMIMQLVETKIDTRIESVSESPTPTPGVGKNQDKNRQKMRFQVVPHLSEGYYIVANVFKSRSNLFTFLNKLQEKGLSPDYFISNENGLNYVYLGYFVDAGKARDALKNDFNGKYGDDKWILRVFNNSYTANTYQDGL
ncbi:MAG: SPOR domain-containing protein, partial [Flavobacteriaceae bacterium]